MNPTSNIALICVCFSLCLGIVSGCSSTEEMRTVSVSLGLDSATVNRVLVAAISRDATTNGNGSLWRNCVVSTTSNQCADLKTVIQAEFAQGYLETQTIQREQPSSSSAFFESLPHGGLCFVVEAQNIQNQTLATGCAGIDVLLDEKYTIEVLLLDN